MNNGTSSNVVLRDKSKMTARSPRASENRSVFALNGHSYRSNSTIQAFGSEPSPPMKTMQMPDRSILQLVPPPYNDVVTDDSPSIGAYPAYLAHSSYSNDRSRPTSSEMAPPKLWSQPIKNEGLPAPEPKRKPETVFVYSSQIYAGLAGLWFAGFGAAIMALLSLQLLFALRTYHFDGLQLPDRQLAIIDAATVFAMICLTFSTATLMITALQLLLSCKILKLSPNAGVRILLYLRQGVVFRMICFGGLFASIPAFLIGVLLYIAVFTSEVTLAVSTVIVVFGVLLCLVMFAHSCYSWLWGVLKLPPEDIVQPRSIKDALILTSPLSTLV